MAPVNTASRAPFSQYEKKLLKQLVDKNRRIIEDRRTNSITKDARAAAWTNVMVAFNATFGVTKSTEQQLKQCYQNMKKRAAKSITDHKMLLKKTIDGEKPSSPRPIEEKLVLTQPITMPCDSHDVYHREYPSVKACTEEMRTSPITVNVEPDDLFVVDRTDISSPGCSQEERRPLYNRWQLFRKRTRPNAAKKSGSAKVADALEAESRKQVEVAETKLQMDIEEHNMKAAKHKIDMEMGQKKLELLNEKLKLLQNLNKVLLENPSKVHLCLANESEDW